MPQFKAPRHGVTIAEAFHEAANIATDDTLILDTFELWHPSLAAPIYVVSNFEALLATKESGADRDPSVQVEFLAAPGIALQRPTESDAASPGEMELVVPNISGVFSRAVRAARGSASLWEIIERFYDAADTGAPSQTPMKLTVIGVEITTRTVTMRCAFTDQANFAIPRITFRRAAYPGLVR